MFAGVETAARIERAECGLLVEHAQAIAAAHGPGRVYFQSLAGGVAMHSGPGSPLNKVAGLGFGGLVSDAELGPVERVFAERGAAVQVELADLGDPAVAKHLTQRGYALVGHENVLGLRLPAAVTWGTGGEIEVSGCEADAFESWLETVSAAFASADDQGVSPHETTAQDVLREILRDARSVATMRRYVARRGGLMIGGASMRVADGVAHLCGAATLPAHRRRGAQSALLAARLRDAAALGCDLAVVTTAPGSKSQENAQRRGFALLYTRAVLVRESRAPRDGGRDAPPQVALETDRLRLRELALDDAGALNEIERDARVTRYMAFDPQTAAETRAYIEGAMKQQHESPRRAFDLAIVLRGSGLLIGRCGFEIRRPEHREAMLWYELHPDHWGRGYAVEAMRAVLEFAFCDLQVHRVWADCDPRNAASCRVAERLGMTLEGRLRENYWLKEEWCSSAVYGLLANEWERDARRSRGGDAQ